jgi:invasion protein IalB
MSDAISRAVIGVVCVEDVKLHVKVRTERYQTALLFYGLLFLTALLAPEVRAQTPPPETKAGASEQKAIELPTQGWNVNCASTAGAMSCQATQSIGIAQTKQLLAAISVFKIPGPPAGHAMTLKLPHGLFLPAGANVQIDTEPAQAVVVETCDQQGCYANLPVSEKMLGFMRKGKQLAITFQNMSKSNVRVQLSLDGFPEALKKL